MSTKVQLATRSFVRTKVQLAWKFLACFTGKKYNLLSIFRKAFIIPSEWRISYPYRKRLRSRVEGRERRV